MIFKDIESIDLFVEKSKLCPGCAKLGIHNKVKGGYLFCDRCLDRFLKMYQKLDEEEYCLLYIANARGPQIVIKII